MINLRILVPEATTNYCKNPSFETGTAGWTVRSASDSENYYLYDQFTTARAAGSVNNTLAEPVGGTRNVTDTGSKMSIAGGLLLSEQNGAGSATDPILSYEGRTRSLGVTLLGTMTAISNRSRMYWAVASKSSEAAGLLSPISTNLFFVQSGVSVIVNAVTAGETYQFAYVLRTSGIFVFIKGGSFTNWTLAYTSLSGTTATLYPTINAFLGNQSSDNIRVPKRTYIPTPLQSDSMSATTTDGLGNPENNGTAGNAYTNVGTWGVAAGVRSCSALSGGLGFSYLACSSSNVIIEAVCTRTAGNTGIVARYVDASNYLIAYHDGANARLDRVVAGVTTNLLTAVVAYSATAVTSLHLDGTAARLFYNNTAIGTVAVTPAAGSLNHGLYTTNTGATFDNLVIWARGNSETQYAGLDTFEFDPAPDTENRSTERARFGTASCKVTTDGSLLNEGIYYRVNWLQGISDVLTASIYARGGGKVRLRLTDGGSNSGISKAVNLTDDRWTRLEVTGRCSGSDDIRLYIETAESLPRSVTFYVDGAQIERKSAATSYCDGDQPGCRWNVVANATISTRTADTREGGRWVPLAGPCRPNNDLYVTTLGGFGMPPIVNNIQSWANAPGSFFQNEKIQNRVVTFSFHVKKETFRTGGSAPSILALHELRQQLINLFKSDVTLNSQAFLFEYSDSETDKKLYIRMRYEAGLEGEWDIRNRWFNSFPVRMIAVDPLWSEDSQDVMPLGTKETSTQESPIWMKKEGQWQILKDSSGATIPASTHEVFEIKEGNDGTIYIVSGFTSVGRIDKWDGTNLVSLGVVDDAVWAVEVGPDGNVYFGGEFTTIGGVAADCIAKYNPTTGVFSALGAGVTGGASDRVESICAAPNGQIYIGGLFSTVGGIACQNIARWDGFQWRTVGATSGVNGRVRTIFNAGDGQTLYIGGAFTASNGGSVTLVHVASVDITTNLLSQMGDGVTGDTYVIRVSSDGTPFAGNNIGVSKYIGSSTWQAVGEDFNESVRALEFGEDGVLYAGGYFTLSGDKPLIGTAKFFGGNWLPMSWPFKSTGSTGVESIIEASNGDLFVGGLLNGLTDFAKLTTITNNGTASCWPILTVMGSGTLSYLSNVKTGQEIFLDLTVFSGETVTIDFARGKIESDTRSDLNYTLLSGSEIRSIYLLPGENTISVLMNDDVNATMQLRWEPLDWSADAIIEADDL